MSRIIDEPIIVHSSPDSSVRAFVWRRRHYKVHNILCQWREPSHWWNGEVEKIYLRVAAINRSPGIYELYNTDGKWFLHCVID